MTWRASPTPTAASIASKLEHKQLSEAAKRSKFEEECSIPWEVQRTQSIPLPCRSGVQARLPPQGQATEPRVWTVGPCPCPSPPTSMPRLPTDSKWEPSNEKVGRPGPTSRARLLSPAGEGLALRSCATPPGPSPSLGFSHSPAWTERTSALKTPVPGARGIQSTPFLSSILRRKTN